MINESIKTNRMIGMAQQKALYLQKNLIFLSWVFRKISSFSETDDGRYVIVLNGITRFNILDEIDNKTI